MSGKYNSTLLKVYNKYTQQNIHYKLKPFEYRENTNWKYTGLVAKASLYLRTQIK